MYKTLHTKAVHSIHKIYILEERNSSSYY